MKILVMPKPREGVPAETLQQQAPDEIRAVWELYTQGFVREFYARTDTQGRVVLVVESESVEAAREALNALPFVRHELIGLDLIPLAPMSGLARAFQSAS